MRNKFTKKQWTIIGILVLGLALFLILKASLNLINILYILPLTLMLLGVIAWNMPIPKRKLWAISALLLLGIAAVFYVLAFIDPYVRYDVIEIGIWSIFTVVGLLLVKLDNKYGSNAKKYKKAIFGISSAILALFTLYSLLNNVVYFIIVALILIPLFFYPTKKFLHVNSLFYFISGFSIFFVQGFIGVFNIENLAFAFLFVTYTLSGMAPVGAARKIHKKPKRTKLKFYSLKENKTGISFILSIWIIIEFFLGFSAFLNKNYAFSDSIWFLMASGFCAIIFVPSMIWFYKKQFNIEVDSEKIVLIKSGKREEVQFKDCQVVKITRPRDETQWYKHSNLYLRGKKNVDIQLSNYSPEDVIVLKNMLYTYTGDKFRYKGFKK